MVTTDTTPNNKRINNKYRDLDKEIVRLGRSGKTSDALELYSSIDRPSIRNLNSAIDACSRARPTRLEKAKEIFQAGVQEKNLQPNVFTFGALMNACLRARNGGQAMTLLRSMQVRCCYKIHERSMVAINYETLICIGTIASHLL
jgi:pentatricopeptide repeat protein